ncbi:MAG: hypothetical protein HC903_21095 [Methylacidiphilales bacterium]|nr:hypothetical protein [Candidatus Methylacidiphilales bacterium]
MPKISGYPLLNQAAIIDRRKQPLIGTHSIKLLLFYNQNRNLRNLK